LNRDQTKEELKKQHSLSLINKILESVIDLVQDAYGNYAVTEIISVRLNKIKN